MFLASIGPAGAQSRAPTPKPIERATWAATPLWRAPVDAEPGFAIAEITPLHQDADGLTLLVREKPPGFDQVSEQHVRLERRGPAGEVLWRQAVPGLPSRFGAFRSAFVQGTNGGASLLAMTFLPSEHREAVPYGRLVEIDERTGTLTLHGGIPRPQVDHWNSTDNDAIDLLGLLRLENDRVALYGGFGTGPYQWWIAKERLNGRLLWQAVGRNSVGGITALRVVPGGYDASAYVIMSSLDPSAVGAYRLRFDDAGKLVSATKMASNGQLLFLTDGATASISTGDPPTLRVQDPQGRQRTLAALPRGATLLGRLDDGSWMLSDDSNDALVVSADGRSAFHIERDIRYDSILSDGTVFAAFCRSPGNCVTRYLALYKRPW